ncbi:hypothetical protein DITRI_Ditri05aG0006800 [Diplodiscus trichospermus]
MEILHRKLKRLKPILKDFNKKHFAELSNRVGEKIRELEVVQVEILKGHSGPDSIQQEKSLPHELYNLLIAEESFFKKKSRIQWLNEGDSNTKFFHSMMAAKQKQNYIFVLKDSEENILKSFEQFSSEAVTFFQRLIGAKDDKVTGANHELSSELLTPFSEEACAEMSNDATLEEI